MDEPRLTLDEKKELLRIARATLEQRLAGKRGTEKPGTGNEERSSAGDGGGNAGPGGKEMAGLEQPRGAFVTLTRRGRLRGCIGTFRAGRALADVVREMALSAALRDPRFDPVTARELPELEIEISALTPLREIRDVNEIVVGQHGIYITRGRMGGVLLPQVAVEHGWDREEFLDHTCTKAGLPPGSWKSGATIEIFSAEVFSEADPEGSKVSCAD